jgi:hypothetical protein
MWYRVFSRAEREITPSALAELLHGLGYQFTPHFRGDDLGWTAGELHVSHGSPIILHRYLTKHDKLRDDLNTYAAELETMTYSPNHTMLMERVIQTQQLITVRKPIDHADESTLEALLDAVSRYYAQETDGIIQIDGKGWFDATGEMLIQEY